MPFPDSPCDACPRNPENGPCLARQYRNPRYCMHAANGHAGYIAILKGDPPPPPPMPPLLTRAFNLAGSIVAAVRSRAKRASPAEQARRLAICGGCEFFKAEGKACLKCGCNLPLKTRLEALHCPIDKW